MYVYSLLLLFLWQQQQFGNIHICNTYVRKKINSKKTNLFIDLPIFKYIFYSFFGPTTNIYIYVCACTRYFIIVETKQLPFRSSLLTFFSFEIIFGKYLTFWYIQPNKGKFWLRQWSRRSFNVKVYYKTKSFKIIQTRNRRKFNFNTFKQEPDFQVSQQLWRSGDDRFLIGHHWEDLSNHSEGMCMDYQQLCPQLNGRHLEHLF